MMLPGGTNPSSKWVLNSVDRCWVVRADVQNEQRQRRKDEQAAGTEWQCVRFTHTDEDVEYQRLVEMLHDKYQPAHEDGYVFKG